MLVVDAGSSIHPLLHSYNKRGSHKTDECSTGFSPCQGPHSKAKVKMQNFNSKFKSVGHQNFLLLPYTFAL